MKPKKIEITLKNGHAKANPSPDITPHDLIDGAVLLIELGLLRGLKGRVDEVQIVEYFEEQVGKIAKHLN